MQPKYRWWVVGGVVALALVGGALFSRYAASAAPGAPWAAGNGAWGPGMMAQFWRNGAGSAQQGPGNRPGYWGGMMGNNPQAFAAMQQMHNAMWGGYSGSNGSEPDEIPQAPAEPGAKRVEVSVSIKEWKMDPATITVPAGSRLVLTVRNDGTMEHHFELEGLGVHLHDIAPGATRTVEINADKAGTYTYLCDIPGHAQLGQQGTLTITPAN